MQHRTLGESLRVSALSLGCMGMSEFYGATDEQESIATIHRALDSGVTMLDTADVYGPHTNEELVGRAIQGRRAGIVVATKFGIVRTGDPAYRGVNGRPEYVRASCDASLRRLSIDVIDLYYQHRVDPATPIEDTVGAMADLVRAGKVRYIGLSEAGAETLRRAASVHPIAALQSEYSLWTRDPEGGVLAACRELGIGLVAYSPLGRGFLTGRIRSEDDLGARRFPTEHAAVPGRAPAEEPGPCRGGGGDRAREGLHARATCARLGPRARGRHRADRRDQAANVSRREPRRAQRASRRRGSRAA